MDLDRPDSEIRDSAGLADDTRGETVLPREVYTLLAQANLLRMRGCWEEAAQSCMEALRLAPDSASANSLLGDIYENQGRYDDAAQWYRMALDAHPDSPADRLKLDRLRQRAQSPMVGKLPEAEEALPPQNLLSQGRLNQSGWRRLIRDPEMALRYGAIAAALGLILVVFSAFIVVHHAGSLHALGISGEAVDKSAPVIVPPLAGALPADPDGVPTRDPSEQTLLTALQASRDLSALGIAVYDVQVDPRISRVSVTFGLPLSAGLTQAQVVRDALQVLQAAVAAGQSPDLLTARCLLVSSLQSSAGNGAGALAFVGDSSRDAVQTSASAGSGLSDTQAAAVFSNVWWSLTADIRA